MKTIDELAASAFKAAWVQDPNNTDGRVLEAAYRIVLRQALSDMRERCAEVGEMSDIYGLAQCTCPELRQEGEVHKGTCPMDTARRIRALEIK